MDGTWAEKFQTRSAAILATAPFLLDCLGRGGMGGRIPASGMTGGIVYYASCEFRGIWSPGIILFPAFKLTALSLAGASAAFFAAYGGFFHRPANRISRLHWS